MGEYEEGNGGFILWRICVFFPLRWTYPKIDFNPLESWILKWHLQNARNYCPVAWRFENEAHVMFFSHSKPDRPSLTYPNLTTHYIAVLGKTGKYSCSGLPTVLLWTLVTPLEPHSDRKDNCKDKIRTTNTYIRVIMWEKKLLQSGIWTRFFTSSSYSSKSHLIHNCVGS